MCQILKCLAPNGFPSPMPGFKAFFYVNIYIYIYIVYFRYCVIYLVIYFFYVIHNSRTLITLFKSLLHVLYLAYPFYPNRILCVPFITLLYIQHDHDHNHFN